VSPSRHELEPALLEAARLWGVQLAHESVDHREVRASTEAVLAALRELGAPVESPADLATAVRVGRVARWADPVEPVCVCWDGAPFTVPLRLLAAEVGGAIRCELTREDGSTSEWTVAGEHLSGTRVVEVEGREQVAASIELPADLPQGYHDFTVHAGARRARARVLRAPRRAWTPEREGEPPPRAWGVFEPTYALRSARSPGIGDLTDLETLQRWTAAHGGSFVGTLPLLPTFLDEPFDPSPYAPVSRLFWNELYLDPERVPGFEQAPRARALAASDAYRRERDRLCAVATVEYRAAALHRRALLEALAADLAPPDAPLPVELAELVAARPELEDYAAFQALVERHRVGWRDWPAHLRAGSVARRDYDEGALRRHLLAQWATDRQLGAQAPDGGSGAPTRLARLYLDLPLGSHPDGFDVWRWRELFADASAGAPPDLYFKDGQDWGFPPLHPARARADGHRYWAASLRHVMRVAAMLRLDHVMGLHRLYWIPRGMPSSGGVYVRYPAEELYAVLCLESHRHRTEVVGEDLGTVPDEVRTAMEAHALRRTWVIPFELDVERAALSEPPAGAVASVGVHDLPPFRGFVEGRDLAGRPESEGAARRAWADALARALRTEDAGPATLLAAALARLAASPARLVLVALEDLWLETEAHNQPGTASDRNWKARARHALEELDELPEAHALLAAVDAGRRAPAGEAPREHAAAADPVARKGARGRHAERRPAT
jgi:4-alpha-glucanotransferase